MADSKSEWLMRVKADEYAEQMMSQQRVTEVNAKTYDELCDARDLRAKLYLAKLQEMSCFQAKESMSGKDDKSSNENNNFNKGHWQP